MSVRTEQLTAEQRAALAGEPHRTNLLITGPPASGRTTTLHHAAMHLQGQRVVGADHMLLLVPDDESRARARRQLEAYRSLRWVRVMTPVQLARTLNPDRWRSDEVLAGFGRRYTAERRRQLDEREPTDQVPSDLTNLLRSADDNALSGPAANTDLERLLAFIGRHRRVKEGGPQRSELQAAFPLILIDDLDRFSLSGLLLAAALTQQHGPEPQSQLLLTSGTGPRFQAWQKVRQPPQYLDLPTLVPEVQVPLTARMNRREVLDLLEVLSPAPARRGTPAPAPVFQPARGFGGRIEVRPGQALRRLAPDARSELLHLTQRLHAVDEDDPATQTLLHTLQTLQRQAFEAGRDLAIVFDTYSAGDVGAALSTGFLTALRPLTEDIPHDLTAALRCVCHLSRPGGGHPLYDSALGHNRFVSQAQRRQADAAWTQGRPLPVNAPHAELERNLQAADTTAAVLELLRTRTLRSALDVHDLNQLPDEPLRALEHLLARNAQPRLWIGTLHKLTHSWSDVILISRTALPQDDFRHVVERTLDHLTLMILGEARTVAGETQVLGSVRQAASSAWPTALLTGQENASAQQLRELLDHPHFGPYLRDHAPRHVSATVLTQWLRATRKDAPAAWRSVREPARPWHLHVTLQEEQQALEAISAPSI